MFGPRWSSLTKGQEFVNQVNSCPFEKTGWKQHVSSAYHPQTNGLDKRLNQTLVTALKKEVDTCSNKVHILIVIVLVSS